MLFSSGDERSAIEHYFNKGFCYGTIVQLLAEYHDILLNVKTLKRRPSQFRLRRRNHFHSEHFQAVQVIIKHENEGRSSAHFVCRGMYMWK